MCRILSLNLFSKIHDECFNGENTHAHTHTRTRAHAHTYMHTHTHAHACMHAHTHAHNGKEKESVTQTYLWTDLMILTSSTSRRRSSAPEIPMAQNSGIVRFANDSERVMPFARNAG